MRAPLFAFALLALAASCKKKDDTTPARSGPNVSASALSQQFVPGSYLLFNYYTATSGSLQPATGTGQTWNYSSLSGGTADTMRLVAASNSSFPSATYARTQQIDFGVGGNTQPINISTYYEVSNNGWFELGRSLPAVNFVVPGTATINFSAQSNAYTPNKMPWTPPLPAYEGDTVSFTSVIQENGTVTAPNFFLNNAPIAQKTTYSGGLSVVGSGSLQRPGAAAPVNALLIRRRYTRTDNFLLNGTTPPVQMLALLGIVDGQTTAVVSYDFYGQGSEGYLGSIYQEDGSTLYAYFRK
ncbi:hypothetical protein [Flaviaesturariibacter terrae]